MNRALRLALASSLLAAPGISGASEGKWTPQQMLELDPAWLRAQGLRLKPSQLWDNQKGTGLLAGTVNTEGCSGGFISPEGLFITNHHCLYGVIQEHSTPAANLLEQGFLARSRQEELPGKAERVLVIRRFTDVTAEVLAAAKEAPDDLARFRAVERRRTELAQACERRPATRCQVEAFEGGLSFVLVDSVMLLDVRLVYAPPRAVGEFGGEADNWSWPRHTGDFAIGRAYVAPDGSSRPYNPANVPYRAASYFPLSSEGVTPGDFVAVLGYPGTTYRALTAPEMAVRQERSYPAVIDLGSEWIRIMESVPASDRAGRISVSSLLKRLHNRHKNATGQLEGFRRWNILERQRSADELVRAWAAGRREQRAALEAYEGLKAIADERRRDFAREFLLTASAGSAIGTTAGQQAWGSRALALSLLIPRLAVEREKPDLDRAPAFLDRELQELKERAARDQKNYHPPTDEKLFASFVRRALALPEGQRLAGVDALFGHVPEAELEGRIHALCAKSQLMDPVARAAMLEESPAQLKARHDPLLDFGFSLEPELARLRDALDRRSGASLRLTPTWRRAVIARAGKPVAPDANGTLRVSFGKVQGYSPRDGILYTPQTTLAGMIAKHTGTEPFDAPEKVRAAAARRGARWADSRLLDVPLDFLADADTTGGNSGSPVIDSRGRLVGVNFDRVWENVANDFGYLPEVGRNISVEVRFVLWMLDQVDGADELLQELGVPRSGGAR